MRVNPISEKDAAAQSSGIFLWPNGEYDYEVRDATEETSKAGNEQIKLEMWVFNHEGNRKFLFDYLVASEKAQWKVRHFASSCGLLAQYEKGDLIVADIVGRTGKCILGTQNAKDGYEARNAIRDYVKAEGDTRHTGVSVPPAQAREKVGAGGGTDLEDDIIPF